MSQLKLSELEIRANAMLAEVGSQRMAMGDRAAILAGDVAMLKAQVADLTERLKQALSADKSGEPKVG